MASGRRLDLAAAGALLGLFGFLLWPWMCAAPDSYPLGGRFNLADAGLASWVMAYVAHAVSTGPWDLLQAPVFHPAPAQLSSSEHLGASALLFAPVYLWSGNAVLTANVAVLCSYPLAAFWMWKLLRHHGIGGPAAFVGGVAMALGVLRVPGSVYLAKLPNWVLPLLVFGISRLRESGTGGRAVAVAGAAVFAAMTSYYMALLAALAALVWTAADATRADEGRGRFLGLVVLAGGAATTVVTALSLPYLAHQETFVSPVLTPEVHRVLEGTGRLFLSTAGVWLPRLAWLGLLALPRRDGAGRMGRRGLALMGVAAAFLYGPEVHWWGVAVETPFAWLQRSPLAFFRYPFLFCVLHGFGLSLLVAAGLDAAGRLVPARIQGLPAILALALVIAERGPLLSSEGFHPSEGERHPIYAAVVAAAAADGAGPLLQLPLAFLDNTGAGLARQESEMVGSTRHWLRLVGGVTGYPASHATLLARLVERLPAPAAVADLVSLTGVRWVLLRPAADWRAPRPSRAEIAGSPALVRTAQVDEWDLFRVNVKANHPEWSARIAAGTRPGTTVLGTSLAPLDPAATLGAVALDGPTGVTVEPGKLIGMSFQGRNLGGTTWPIAVPFDRPVTGQVIVAFRWHDASGQPLPTEVRGHAELLRDVFPGERFEVFAWAVAPSAPGAYQLGVELRQRDGAVLPLHHPPIRRLVHVVQAEPHS